MKRDPETVAAEARAIVKRGEVAIRELKAARFGDRELAAERLRVIKNEAVQKNAELDHLRLDVEAELEALRRVVVVSISVNGERP